MIANIDSQCLGLWVLWTSDMTTGRASHRCLAVVHHILCDHSGSEGHQALVASLRSGGRWQRPTWALGGEQQCWLLPVLGGATSSSAQTEAALSRGSSEIWSELTHQLQGLANECRSRTLRQQLLFLFYSHFRRWEKWMHLQSWPTIFHIMSFVCTEFINTLNDVKGFSLILKTKQKWLKSNSSVGHLKYSRNHSHKLYSQETLLYSIFPVPCFEFCYF